MIKILHRINDPEQLAKVDPLYGVEMDVHGYGERLVIHHDPLTDGPDLSEWLDACGDRFVILNIKEEGIESRVQEMALDAGLTDFFFLDLSFPALIKMVRGGESRIAIRVSEYESVESALLLSSQIDWVWLDCFEGFPLTGEEFQRLKSGSFKICLVSPELHGPPRTRDDIQGFQEIIGSLDIELDAVCTKFPELW